MNKHSLDLLAEACAAAGRLQVWVRRQGKAEIEHRSLFLPLAVVGREENNDLPLHDHQVSRRHAYLQLIGGRLFGVDLRSRTGTFWGAERKPSGWVDRHQVLGVGPYTLQFLEGDASDGPPATGDWDPLTSVSPDAEATPDVALEMVKGPSAPFSWRMTSSLGLVGRRAVDYGLALPDPEAPSFQCGLLRTPIGTWVIDLLGEGGIRLNGRRVRWGRLEDGDQLQVGRFLLGVRLLERAPPVTCPEAPATPAATEAVRVVDSQHAGTNGDLTKAPEAAAPAEPVSAEPAPPPTAAGPLIPVAPSLPRADLNEPMLASLFNQFAAMQHQMFDQFQQAIMMMVEMFSDMQRDQVGLIRQEVDRLHQIGEELQVLQTEMARQPVPPPSWVPMPFPAPPPPQEAPASAAAGPAATPADASRAREATPTPEGPPADAGVEEMLRKFEAAGSPAAEAETSPAKEPAANSHAKPTSPGLDLPQPPLGPVDGEVHLWLYEKMAALQRERQSRLQKIINFLRGQ